MKKETARIRELLDKFLNNHCTREEFEELIVLAQDPENERFIKEYNERVWQQGGKPLKEPPSNRNRNVSRSVFLKIAAAVVLIFTVGFVWVKMQLSDDGDPITFRTGNGEVKEIVLPDSTIATLNANSQLTWFPTRFQEERQVDLTGEAYFKVVRKPQPGRRSGELLGFRVKTSKMIIHVTGTEFNVVSRSVNTEVFLQEGSVEYELTDRKTPSEHMVPGEKISINNETGDVVKTGAEDLSTSASWVNGILNYSNKPLGEVLRNLSDLFGVEINCQDEDLISKKINLGVPYMDWDNTRRALEMAINVEFKQEENRYSVIQK